MGTLKILIVEDNKADFTLTKRLIEGIPGERKMQVDWVGSYADGLKACAQREHDIYFIDYKLDRGNALDLISTLSRKGHPGPFIILTGHDQHYLYEKSIKSNIYDFLLKDELTSSMLARTISYAMERQRIEKALKIEKALCSFIISEISSLVISVDKDGNIGNANPAVMQATGYTSEELVGKNWKILIPEGEREKTSFQVKGGDNVEFSSKLITKEGDFKFVEWDVLSKGLDFEGQDEFGFILHGKDVTDHLEYEATERQRQKMEALGQLAGGVAHEINNLLQPILLSASMIKTKYPDDENLEKISERITRNTNSAAKIVNDILMFARKENTTRTVLPLSDVFALALEMSEEMLPEAVHIDAGAALAGIPGDVKIYVNQTDMVRVISNLSLNAAQAMGNKGTIIFSSEIIEFDERSTALDLQSGRYVRIDVKDTGVGIAPESLESIFNPFFTTKNTGEGTGLGLSIVYNILKGWRGNITVDSEEGKGSAFSIYVPLYDGRDLGE